jgi:hypothetical protein
MPKVLCPGFHQFEIADVVDGFWGDTCMQPHAKAEKWPAAQSTGTFAGSPSLGLIQAAV